MPWPESPPASPTAAPGGRSRWLLIVGVVALVATPAAVLEWPSELVRWRIAAAHSKYVAGDTRGALAVLDQVLEAHPDSSAALASRAAWRLEVADYAGALADCRRAAQLAPRDLETQQRLMTALQHAGLHDEAIAVSKKLVEDAPADVPRAMLLNGLAYAQAVGDRELDQALANIQGALQDLPDAVTLLTQRGQVLAEIGHLSAALADFEAAADALAARRAELQKAAAPTTHSTTEQPSRQIASPAEDEEPPAPDAAPGDASPAGAAPAAAFAPAPEQDLEAVTQVLVRAHLLRAWACERGQRADLAEKARQEITRLGRDPKQEKLGKVELDVLADSLSTFAAYVDTRGYVEYRRGNHEAALADFHAAVRATEAVEALMARGEAEARLSEVDSARRARQAAKLRANLVVLWHHRALAWAALGDAEAAERDWTRVRAWGFEPGEHLF